MIQQRILLSQRQTTQNTLRKVIGDLIGNEHFIIPDLPMVPPEIDTNEFLVSAAMKLSCNENQRVCIFGIDKRETVEKDIPCRRFHRLVEFIPSFNLKWLILQRASSHSSSRKLPCEMNCTVFGSRCNPRKNSGNLYTGKLILKICHQLGKRNLDKFLTTMPLRQILEKNELFIPHHNNENSLVQSLLDELKKLDQIRLHSKDKFKQETTAILESELYKEFPYFHGEE